MAKGLDAAAMLGRGRGDGTAQPTTQPGQAVSSTSRLVDSPPAVEAPLVDNQAVTYVKMAVSLTPDQQQWLKRAVPDLGVDGLSSSDLARLAIARLQREVADGLPLADLLIEQAHDEAQYLAGRRNRGMPRKRN